MERGRKGKKKIKINYKRLVVSIIVIVALLLGGYFIIKSLFGKDDTPDVQADPVTPTGAGVGTGQGEDDQGAASFGDLYYYELDKQSRYEAYAEQNPEMAPEDVVWRVNVGLDQAFYSNVLEIVDTGQMPLLVNKYRKLPDDYEPADLVNTSSGQQMTAETKTAYEQMRDDASGEGHKISAVSGYRSIEYQKGLYNRYLVEDDRKTVDTYSARAGHSEHHTGRAVDLVGPSGTLQGFRETKEADWVYANAYKYGFIVRYTEENTDITGYVSEPWHVTYVGVTVAEAMRNLGITSLEEYVVKYVDHTPPQE